MHRSSISLLCAGLFAPFLAAQSGNPVGPGMLDADTATTGHQNLAASVYFNSTPGGTAGPATLGDITKPYPLFNGTGTGTFVQVHATKNGMSGLAAGEYAMSFTVTNLNTGYGATGTTQQVVMGKVSWNANGNPTFVPHATMAAKLNVTGNVFGLMIDDKDGRRAALDHPSYPAWSLRADNSKDFPAAVQLTGITGTYVDPAPAYYNGVLGVLWVSSTTTLSWAPVTETVSNGVLTAAAVDTTKAVVMITATVQPHSPTPIVNHKTGELQGLWFSQNVASGDSDQYFAGSLPDTSGGVLVHDTTVWSNNGAVCGSRFFCAYNGHSTRLLEGRGAYATTNNNVVTGTSATANMEIVSITSPKASVFTAILALGTQYATPVTLPGFLGQLAVNPLLILNPIANGGTADEYVGISVVPYKFLKGATLYLQNACGPVLAPALTNTIAIKFQ